MSSINLLPPQIKEDQLYARRNRNLLSFAKLMVVATIFSVGVLALQQQLLNSEIDHINNQLRSVQTQAAELAPIEIRAAQDEKQLNAFQSLSSGKTNWGYVLRSLSSLTPKGIYITAVTSPQDSKSPLKIDGSAKDRTSIASFSNALSQSGLFSGVEIQTSAPDFDSVGFAKYTFEIDATTTQKVDR